MCVGGTGIRVCFEVFIDIPNRNTEIIFWLNKSFSKIGSFTRSSFLSVLFYVGNPSGTYLSDYFC